MFYRFRFFIYAFLILTLLFCFSLFAVVFTGKDEPIGYSTPKTDLNGVFSVYNGKVYAMVPSNGYYEVKGADSKTFTTFSDNFQDAHIGFDDRYVYAGNIILEGLNPKTLQVLGNNYYTDGKTTYYCARNSESNENLSAVGFVIRLGAYNFGWSDKPQNYWYPFTELPKNKKYSSQKGFAIGGNEQQGFFKGKEMPKANPQTLRPIPVHYPDGDVRESNSYFTDGSHVYYQDQLLNIAYNPGLFEAGIEGDIPSRTEYLIDEKQGMVYADGHSFDASAAPYKMLTADLKHANQALFISPKGLYFYNTESEKAERAGDSPFPGNQFQQLDSEVFTSNDKVYYLAASEHWGRKTGLQSRSTHLLELEDVQASDLKKLDQGENKYVNIWQAGHRYFYFDENGSSNLMSSSLYEIKDAATAGQLLSQPSLRYSNLVTLKESGKLLAPESQTMLSAEISYSSEWYQSYWLILGGIVIFYLLTLVFKNKRIHPFVLKDNYLILNNLSLKKYPVAEIDRVIFRVQRSNFRSDSGYSGKMQILMKNGKKSFTTTFSTKVTLASESEATVKAYIQELRDDLEKNGIKTEFMR